MKLVYGDKIVKYATDAYKRARGTESPDVVEKFEFTVGTLKGIIDALTPVDAVEVVHGRWVKKWHDNNLIGHEYEECSACGSCIISDTEKFWDCNYCPNCGAIMNA